MCEFRLGIDYTILIHFSPTAFCRHSKCVYAVIVLRISLTINNYSHDIVLKEKEKKKKITN